MLVRTLAEDTHPDAERVLIELLRRATPARKMALVLDANRTARLLALAGLRERHPGDSPARLRRRLADLWLGPELAAKAYGPLSEHRTSSNERWKRPGFLQLEINNTPRSDPILKGTLVASSYCFC